jgi:alpha-ketoglutarate-dependent taurine dioxygenase
MASAPAHLDVEVRPGRPALARVTAPVDAARWASAQRGALRAAVVTHGAVLVRGLELGSVAEVTAVFHQLGRLTIEKEAFAARRHYSEGVYSSTKWPPNQPMCLHHEQSYALAPPALMLFACLAAPTAGGATMLADAGAVLEALPAELVARFEREGWLLARSYHEELGASIASAFGSEERDAVERYCRANAIELARQPDGGLRTRQLRRAVVRHPVSGQRCWFNQIAFLSEWAMEPEVRDFLIDTYGADGLPFNTRYGGGDPIGADVVRAINAVYQAQRVGEAWQAGDLLLVDNVRCAHGREPFAGPREVLVAMADPARLPGA